MSYSVLWFQLSRGARPAQADINDMNPMMWAAAEGHVGVADLLLRAGTYSCRLSLNKAIKQSKLGMD